MAQLRFDPAQDRGAIEIQEQETEGDIPVRVPAFLGPGQVLIRSVIAVRRALGETSVLRRLVNCRLRPRVVSAGEGKRDKDREYDSVLARKPRFPI